MSVTRNEDILCIRREICKLIKAQKLKAQVEGLLLGNGCDDPILVHIPLDSGISSFSSVDDLYIKPFIVPEEPTGIYAQDIRRRYVNRFPFDCPSLLCHAFTFFYCDQMGPFAHNRVLQKRLLIEEPEEPTFTIPWRGNILVVKHGRTDSGANLGVVDINMHDFVLVLPMIQWLCSKDMECPGTTSPNAEIYRLPLSLYNLLPHEKYMCSRDKAFNSPYVRDLILSQCGPVTVFAYGSCNRSARMQVQMFFSSRVRKVLSRFLPKAQHSKFMDALEDYSCFIVGSVATAVVYPRAVFIPTDLNIIAPLGSFCRMKSVLMKLSLAIGTQNAIKYHHRAWANDFVTLTTSQGLHVTITESMSKSILPLMISGDTSVECVTLGSHTMLSLYPSTFEHGISVPLRGSYVIPRPVITKVSSRFTYHQDGSRLNTKCKEECPTLWRKSRGGRHFRGFFWGGFCGAALSSKLYPDFEVQYVP
ncbi:hypothetical protein C8J55DRAFT_557156 [Lentinula edodes]|uniref:Uncharacterized protein n=1 Tax=Lentinula lateritia TaxID=40482 RepID=A0A9W9DYE1_9AGAR|nr:hypothetical protein C8J55DRAFT_557156 [Lentinula edodes]